MNGNNNDFPQALPQGYLLLGMYTIERVLGQGGYGITYLGTENATGEKIAIKEYFPRDSAQRNYQTCCIEATSINDREYYEKGKRNFLQEARVLAKFAGIPNIVEIRGCFEENDTAYIIMEYIEGITFQQYITQHGGKIPWNDACDKLMPVIKALEEVHKTGIIHRDISPDNIYITSNNTIKLLDFGAARQQSLNQTHSMEEILKPGFAPIEQYYSRGKQGPFTDVYALCATFYAAVATYLPPDAPQRAVRDQLDTFAALGVNVPWQLEQVIFKGLAFDLEYRYQNMTELREAIERAMLPEDATSPKENVLPKQEKIPKEKEQTKHKSPIPNEKKETLGKLKRKFIGILIFFLMCFIVNIFQEFSLDNDTSEENEEMLVNEYYTEGLSFYETTDSDGNPGYEVSCGLTTLSDQLVVIPNYYNGAPVVSIAENAFAKQTSIEEIHIPDTVEVINSFAFEGCSALKKINIPSSVTTMGAFVFYQCSSLTEIKIPASVVYMEHANFRESAISIIYCEAESKPLDWDKYWTGLEMSTLEPDIIWGYKE